MSTRINLHYGPDRQNGMHNKGVTYDHPFGRLMPDEVVEMLDQWLKVVYERDVILVEELPFTYLRYLIRKGDLMSDQVHVYWHEEGVRELRLGLEGELLDPWPTGHFDRTLEFVLGAWS